MNTKIREWLKELVDEASLQFDGLNWETSPQTAAMVVERDGTLYRYDEDRDVTGCWGGRGDGRDQADFRRRFQAAIEVGDCAAVRQMAREERDDVQADADEAAEYGAMAVGAELSAVAGWLLKARSVELHYGDCHAWGPVLAAWEDAMADLVTVDGREYLRMDDDSPWLPVYDDGEEIDAGALVRVESDAWGCVFGQRGARDLRDELGCPTTELALRAWVAQSCAASPYHFEEGVVETLADEVVAVVLFSP